MKPFHVSLLVVSLFPITFMVASTMAEYEQMNRALTPKEIRTCNSKFGYIRPLRRNPGEGYAQDSRTQSDGFHIDLLFATDDQFAAAQNEITETREQFKRTYNKKEALIPEIVFNAKAQTIHIHYPAAMICMKLEVLRQAELKKSKKKSCCLIQ